MTGLGDWVCMVPSSARLGLGLHLGGGEGQLGTSPKLPTSSGQMTVFPLSLRSDVPGRLGGSHIFSWIWVWMITLWSFDACHLGMSHVEAPGKANLGAPGPLTHGRLGEEVLVSAKTDGLGWLRGGQAAPSTFLEPGPAGLTLAWGARPGS